MGVKVGGVESPESHRRLDLQINGPGFHEAFKDCWKRERCRQRDRPKPGNGPSKVKAKGRTYGRFECHIEGNAE